MHLYNQIIDTLLHNNPDEKKWINLAENLNAIIRKNTNSSFNLFNINQAKYLFESNKDILIEIDFYKLKNIFLDLYIDYAQYLTTDHLVNKVIPLEKSLGKLRKENIKNAIGFCDKKIHRKNGLTHLNYNIKADQHLKHSARSIINSFVNDKNYYLKSHVRYVKSGSVNFWDNRYIHKYSNMHYDQQTNSLNLIIYLQNTDENSAPLKFFPETNAAKDQHLGWRILHNMTHVFVTTDNGLIDEEKLRKLPKTLQMGNRIGSCVDSTFFEQRKLISTHGVAGSYVIFHGFNTIHDGGFPRNIGVERLALFINPVWPLRRIKQILINQIARRF